MLWLKEYSGKIKLVVRVYDIGQNLKFKQDCYIEVIVALEIRVEIEKEMREKGGFRILNLTIRRTMVQLVDLGKLEVGIFQRGRVLYQGVVIFSLR